MERTNEQLKRILDSNFDSGVTRQVDIENGVAEPENKREEMLQRAAYLVATGEMSEEDMETTRNFLYRDANAN